MTRLRRGPSHFNCSASARATTPSARSALIKSTSSRGASTPASRSKPFTAFCLLPSAFCLLFLMALRLKAYWHRRLVRVLVGVLVFSVALGAQYYLTDVPVPADLAETGKFTPAALRLGQEELIIEGPEVNSAEGVLFSHPGGAAAVCGGR